jgi:hypothetical protein
MFLNDEFEGMKKKTDMAYFKVASQHLLGGTEKKQYKNRS